MGTGNSGIAAFCPGATQTSIIVLGSGRRAGIGQTCWYALSNAVGSFGCDAALETIDQVWVGHVGLHVVVIKIVGGIGMTIAAIQIGRNHTIVTT